MTRPLGQTLILYSSYSTTNQYRSMMSKNKLMIKEFSLLCGVTVKTLRHYEKIGLLQPTEVDEWTGYRYYNVAQMQTLANIRRLKRIGLSLDEILDLSQQGTLIPPAEMLQQKIAACSKELQSVKRRYKLLCEMADSQNKLFNMENFSIGSLPAIIVASHREVIPTYADLGRVCYEKIGPEMVRLGCKCVEPGYCFTMEHHEYRPEQIDIEYCEQVEEMGDDSDIVQFKRFPAIPKVLFVKHVGPYERFYDTFAEAFRYMEEHGLQLGGQPRTCYVDGVWNQEDPEKWLSILQIPLV